MNLCTEDNIHTKTVSFRNLTKGITISVAEKDKKILDRIFITPFPREGAYDV